MNVATVTHRQISDASIELAKADIVGTISKYINIKKTGKDYAACCPFHSERTPSFTVSEIKGIYHCFGCGANGDAITFVMEYEGLRFNEAVLSIVGNAQASGPVPEKKKVDRHEPVDEWQPVMPIPEAVGEPSSVFIRPNGDGRQSLEASCRWAYRDASGALLGYVCRFELPEGGKVVLPQSFCTNIQTGEVRWKWKSFSKPRPLYGLEKLATHPNAQVIVVEGEKTCEAAQILFDGLGVARDKLITVTWPGGGKAVKHVDWLPLSGRNVGLWPDADQKNYAENHPKAGEQMPLIEQPGTVCMLEIANRLEGLASSIKFIKPLAGVPDGWDLADPLPEGLNLLAYMKLAAMPMQEFRAMHLLDPLPTVTPAVLTMAATELSVVVDVREGDMGGMEVNQTQALGAPVSVPPSVGAPKRRTVRIVPGQLPNAVDQAEAALVEQCNDIFQRAGVIVRPVHALIEVADGQQVDGVRLSQVSKHHLAERLTGAANWEKYDGRADNFVPSDCPVRIADTYLARDGSWRLKVLAGIIDAPTLRPDGSILDTEGFDEKTGLLLLGDQSRFKPIPESPSKEDAQEALGRLLDLIATFPFASNQDRSVALSGILTACIRRSLLSAPMHCFSAPTAGSGKSMLVDLASIIACGRQAAVMSQGRDEAEQEKRLASALLAGDQVITVDNATLPIDGDLLCQVLTQQSVRLRVLGASVLRTMPTNAAFFATGNGLLIQGDMTRRALLCSLDPQCERPEQRVFPANPKDVAEKNRANFMCDVLTILRAHYVAGWPQPAGVMPLGSFEVWSQWVRGSLLWLGQADPLETMEKARASDPKLEAIVAVMSQWLEVIGSANVSVKDVVSKVNEPKPRPDADSCSYRHSAPVSHECLHDDLREALLAVAGNGGAINSRSLGKWLAANKGRLIALPGKEGGKSCSFRFVQTTARHGVAIWKLEEVNKAA